MPPEANEQTSRPEKSGKPWVSRLVPYVVGVGAGALMFRRPLFLPARWRRVRRRGCGRYVVGVGTRGFKLKGRPSSWVSWVGYGSLHGLIVVGDVALGGIGAFATWGLFVTLSCALDSGPATRFSYLHATA